MDIWIFLKNFYKWAKLVVSLYYVPSSLMYFLCISSFTSQSTANWTDFIPEFICVSHIVNRVLWVFLAWLIISPLLLFGLIAAVVRWWNFITVTFLDGILLFMVWLILWPNWAQIWSTVRWSTAKLSKCWHILEKSCFVWSWFALW